MAAVATFCATLALAGSVGASIFLAVSLEELTTRADRVVVGRVLWSEAVQTNGGMIRTRHRVRVDQELRGSTAAVVFVETLGGEIGDVGMYVSGEPSLRTDDEVVLFLRSDGNTAFHAIGATQGVMRVERERGGRAMVVPSRQDNLLMRRSEDGRLRKSGAPLTEPQELDVFLETVRAILATEKKDGAP